MVVKLNRNEDEEKSVANRFGEVIGLTLLATATLAIVLICGASLYHLANFLIP